MDDLHFIGCTLLVIVFNKILRIYDIKLCAILTFLIGISIEIIQYLFSLGTFDLKDIVINFFGFLLGMLACYLLNVEVNIRKI